MSNMLRLLQLPPSIQKALQENKLEMGPRALLGTPDRAFQEQLARKAVAEGMSVRAVEEAVKHHGQPKEESTSATSGSAGKLRPPGLLELEELLGDYLATRVNVNMGTKKGKVVIEFSTLEDLERIYRLMTEVPAPEPAG